MNEDILNLLVNEIKGKAEDKIIRVNLKDKTIRDAYNLLNEETIEFGILNDDDEIITVKSQGYILLDAIHKSLRKQLLEEEIKSLIIDILNNAKTQEDKP